MNEDSSKSSYKSKRSSLSRLSDNFKAKNQPKTENTASFEFCDNQNKPLEIGSANKGQWLKMNQREEVPIKLSEKDIQQHANSKDSDRDFSFKKVNALISRQEEKMNKTEQSHDKAVVHNLIGLGVNENNIKGENFSQSPSVASAIEPKRGQNPSESIDKDSVINEWCEKNLNYGFKSHSVFLKSIELKYQIRLQRIFFVIMLALLCTEAFIRSISTQISINLTFCIITLLQQIFVLVSFSVLHRYAPKRSHNRYLVHYGIKILILLLQKPLFQEDSITDSTMLLNQTLMLITFVLIYSPIAECSLLSSILIVLNFMLRQFLFQPSIPDLSCFREPQIQQLLTESVTLELVNKLKKECQQENTLVFQDHMKLAWHDTIIFGFIQTIILCVIVFFSLRQNILEYKLRGKLQDETEKTQFDEPTIGVYDCQSILQLSQLQKVLNATEVGYAIAEQTDIKLAGDSITSPHQVKSQSQINTSKISPVSKNQSRHSQPDFPFKVTNQSMRSFLCGIDQEMSVSANFPLFQKCHIKTLQLDLRSLERHENESKSASSHFSKQTDRGYQDQMEAMDDVRNFSLMELISFIQTHGKFNGGDLLIKTDAYPAKQSDAKYKLSQSSADQVCKAPNNSDESQVRSDLAKLHSAAFEKQETDVELTRGWIVFQLSVRPVIYLGKRQSLVSLTRVNSFLKKVVVGVKDKLTSTLPVFFDSPESLQPFYSIIKTSKFLEKQMSKLAGSDTRTSLLQLKVRSGLMNQKQQSDAFAVYQILLGNMWAFGKQHMMRIKGHLTMSRLKQGRLTLNFQRVSRTSQTVENHVKKFMLQFSAQIEAKDIHVKIQQGTMPDHQLYTDWNLYDQILFQIVQNAVQNSVQGGALSIQIYFRKEISQSRYQENSNENVFEVGRIVTVVKDNGLGIDEATQQRLSHQLFRGNNEIPNYRGFAQASQLSFGLRISQNLVECLGGHLILKSIVGHGTAITFDIQTTTYAIRNYQPHYRVINGDLQLQIPLFRRGSYPIVESQSSDSPSHLKKRGDNSPSSIQPSDKDSIQDSEVSAASKGQLLEKHLTLFDSTLMSRRLKEKNKKQFPHLNFSKSQELAGSFKFGKQMFRRDYHQLPDLGDEESKQSPPKDSQNHQSRSVSVSLRDIDTGEQGQVVQDYASESKKVYMNIAEVLRQTISKNSSKSRQASEELTKQEKALSVISNSISNHTEKRKSFGSKRSHSDPNVNQHHSDQNHSVINPQLKSLSKDSSLRQPSMLDSKSEVARGVKKKILSQSGAPSEHHSSVQSIQDIRLIQPDEEQKVKAQEPPTFNQMRQDSFNRNFIEKRESSKRQPLMGSGLPDLQQSYPQNVYEQIILEASNSVKDDEEEDGSELKNKNSDHFFSDLSIGDSEHFNLGQHEKNVKVFSERPLQDFQIKISQLLKQKGMALFNMGKPLLNNMPLQVSSYLAADDSLLLAKVNDQMLDQSDVSIHRKLKLEVQEQSSPPVSKRSQSSNALNVRMNVASRQKDDRQRSQFSRIASARDDIVVLPEPQISNLLSQRRSKSSFSQNSQRNNLASCNKATCRNVLIIESEAASIRIIQDFIEQIDDRGCDVALSGNQGLRMLAKKLKQNCNCGKENYELIFISMDFQFDGIETIKKVEETFNKWNHRLGIKDHPPVSKAQIIGLQTFVSQIEINSSEIIVLKKPIDLDMLTKVVEDSLFV